MISMTREANRTEVIELDGARGEGGGQILRSALTLSMITGISFRIERIRAGRRKPGLLRQHLTAVRAAAEICGAEVEGAELGSLRLSFRPSAVRGGDYRFEIGSAGSCTLVLQAVLPALWFADGDSTISVCGGTHNRAAPPADFLIRVWQPLLARMGAAQSLELRRHGFYPSGGGEVHASVKPVQGLRALDLAERGAREGMRAEAVVAGIRGEVARREIERVRSQLADIDEQVRELPSREGPGNVVMIEVRHAATSELFTAFGERGKPAERVADLAARQARHYLRSGAAVGEYLADQLVLPFALAGGGRFSCTTLSPHLTTNIEVIGRFLRVDIRTEQVGEAFVVSVGR